VPRSQRREKHKVSATGRPPKPFKRRWAIDELRDQQRRLVARMRRWSIIRRPSCRNVGKARTFALVRDASEEVCSKMNSSKNWATLSNYQSHELVRRDYQRKHGREANAAHTKEICSPFIQAQHYFRAASLADRTVYPLLLYYGVVSLSRGLTLFLSRGIREAALSPSHGLGVRDWQAIFADENPDVANLTIRLSARGTLIELMDATGNRSLLRSNSSAVNVKYGHSYHAGGAIAESW
jgi:hypothetical protein